MNLPSTQGTIQRDSHQLGSCITRQLLCACKGSAPAVYTGGDPYCTGCGDWHLLGVERSLCTCSVSEGVAALFHKTFPCFSLQSLQLPLQSSPHPVQPGAQVKSSNASNSFVNECTLILLPHSCPRLWGIVNLGIQNEQSPVARDI